MTLKPSDWAWPQGGPEGFKGGDSKQRTPVESPDSLRSIATFRIMDLISEGEIGGLVNGYQSIFLDETPLQNPDGSLNFQGVTVDSRNGTQDQTYLPGFPAVENEIAVGVELKSDNAWVQALTDMQLSAVRITIGTPQLQQTNVKNGDVTGYSIQYRIDVRADGGSYVTAYNGQITGKTTTKYQQSVRIDLPPASSSWTIRVTRLTANANSATIADTTTIDSYTEIIDAKLRYPNSALVGLTGDASNFSNIPARAYDVFLRIIQVPSNYDPTTRAYTGTWDGTFKTAWTDNPAWILYDLILHPRYGLGQLINASQINKWELYRIAQYCDQLVEDGKGGQEPRFTLNCYLQSTEDAYKLISDLASAFNGISYWGAGTIISQADMPGDPTVLYTQANVIGGKFTYSASPRKTRYTTALVAWNDPSDFYRQKQEYYEDQPALAKFGIQPASVTAFGCTSQGQAQRMGKWVVLTSQIEAETVTFSVGLDGAIAAPGQIIRVADSARAGARMGGRIKSATRATITVDRAPPNLVAGDSLTVTLPSGATQTLPVTGIVGDVITANGIFDDTPVAGASWMLEKTTLQASTYRVVSVTEDQSDADISFTISALQHNASKFAAIDNGTVIQIPPITGIIPNTQPPPTNVALSSSWVVAQGIANSVLTIAWTPAPGALQYQVEWRRNNGNWISAGIVSSTAVDVQGVYTGNYVARVRAISPGNIVSLPAYSNATDIEGKTGAPPMVTFLNANSVVFGIDVAWGFPEGAEDTQRTELWYSASPDFNTATVLSDLSYPTNTYKMQGLAAGVGFYFWARLIDRSGNEGPFYPDTSAPGVYGESSTDADAILDYLTGQITLTQLSKDLQAEIEKIPALEIDYEELAVELGAVQGEIDVINGIMSYYDPKMAGDTTGFAGDDTYYAGVWSEQYARASADEVMAKEIDTVAAQAGGWQAAIQTETTARVTADEVLAQQVTDVQATADDALGTGKQAQADIRTEQTARIAGDSVNATAIQTVSANLGTTNAAVQTNANAIANVNGTVSASYNIKVQIDPGTGKYYAAGMAIGIDNSSGNVQSQVLFLADRFAILSNANNQVYSPFTIDNGQVFISQAFIHDAWITSAKIADASITSAKISAWIQSDNYDGTNGWIIQKNGSAYFGGNVTVRGDVSADSLTGTLQVRNEIAWSAPSGSVKMTATPTEMFRFTLQAPYRAGQVHSPDILLNVLAGSQTSNNEGLGLILQRLNGDGSWTAIQQYTVTYASAISNLVPMAKLDAVTGSATTFRLMASGGSDIYLYQAFGSVRGWR